MLIVGDNYNLKHFRNGTSVNTLIRDCSVTYIEKLRDNDLIYLTEEKEVFLTEKGQIAKQIGVENYLRLEKEEAQALRTNLDRLKLENKYLLILLAGLFIFLIYLIAGFFI